MLKRLLAGLLTIVLLCGIILWGWYQIDGLPTPETGDYLSGDSYGSERAEDGTLIFRPNNPSGRGIVIMHGALIKPQSYARSAAWFAQQGYTVLLPYGPGRMSIAAVDTVADRMAALTMNEWYFIGHSMGGMASLDSIGKHQLDVSAVALWATSMPADFSAMELPILFIWGTNDDLLPPARFAAAQANLPSSVEYVTLDGANHKNFAMYSHQFFDGEATIDWMEQIDFANRMTTEFFARHHGPTNAAGKE